MSKIYIHNKSGNLYLVIGIGTDAENNKKKVIYQALYENNELYVRDYDNFFEEVELVSGKKPRFENVVVSKK